MINHVMVGSNDLKRSRRFYDAVLGTVGYRPGADAISPAGRERLTYTHPGGGPAFMVTKPLDGAPASHANGGTLGFKADSAEAVVRFQDAGVANGGTAIEDAPGPRQGGAVHVSYLRDPDGNKVCAVWRPG